MLRRLREIADEVARTLQEENGSSHMGDELAMGADGTPTLRIDRLAEDVILEYIGKVKLPWNVLSEEAGYIDNGGDRTLVIDPVDGTYNALMGIPFYSVSLALGRKSMKDVEVALVQNLVTKERYEAERGKGALWNSHPITTRRLDRDDMTLLAYMGRFTEASTFPLVRLARRTRSLGCSSLELCLVARGQVDAYYMNCSIYQKAIRVVDIAAAQLIVKEAGGGLVDLQGKLLDLPFDLAVRSNFIAYGDKSVLEELR
jgi:fructose-1,6-bisphosphatase/inositol monophosphatase family enzyme